jgi:uncharacterized repeat protein (TIGR01451 family)
MKISMNPLFKPLALCCAVLAILPARGAEPQVVPSRVSSIVSGLPAVDRLPATNRLDLTIALPLRNREALTNLLHQLSDPASPKYRQYLTPAQFADQFGPAEADYEGIKAFARSNGLDLKGTHPNRTLVDLTGSVADIERAFKVNLRVYRHPVEGRTFHAPDGPLTLNLDVPVLAVHGLDDYVVPRPAFHRMTPSQIQPARGSGSNGGYMGYDFRSAYLPGVSLDGSGQVVALLEMDGYYDGDIAQYESDAGLSPVPLQKVLLDGFNGNAGINNVEVALDIEVAIAMAPGLSRIIVYEVPNSGSVVADILNRMATDDQAQQISSSWLIGDDPTWDQIYLQYAAQGQSFFQASGDNDAFDWSLPLYQQQQTDDPYVTLVGGTTLTTTGPGGAWVSEKVWNWGGGEGSGGGISPNYAIPVWQQGVDMSGNQGSTTMRNIPDVALTADNVFIVADNGQPELVGGTSAAAPLWAGFTALANQQAQLSGDPAIGFLNPAVYAIGKGPSYRAAFHDITTGDNTWSNSPSQFYAVSGYDLCTGWGTPATTNLINLLAPPASKPLPQFVLVTNQVLGNGIIGFDDCKSVNLILENVGAAAATTVQATLSSSTPGVAIAQAVSAYSDMPVSALGTNLTIFKVSTTPDFVCGTPIHFRLRVNCDQDAATLRFDLPTGVPGSPLRFDNFVPVPIPLLDKTNSPIVVSNINFAIQKVTVSLNVAYTFDMGLQLRLISPDGAVNTLSANNGNGGNDYGISCFPDSVRTTFDDDSSTSITAGSAPFVGTFRPQTPLSIFNGKYGTNVNGAWQLQAVDQFGFVAGVIQCWSLFITPALCLDGGGECPGADLALSMKGQPDPVIIGNYLNYTLLVTNNGPSTAHNVTVSQTLPGTVIFTSATLSQGGYSQVGALVTCSLGTLAPKATASITVVVLPTTPGVISSTAAASSDQADPVLGNNSAIVTTHVNPPSADLAVGLAVAPPATIVGGTLTYTVSVTNNGPIAANLVVATNVLPVSCIVGSPALSQGNSSTVGNVVVCSFGSLGIGGVATATIPVSPTAQGTLVASSSVRSSLFDPVAANNTASVIATVAPAADLALGLTESPDPVITGNNLSYTVMVTNLGPNSASSVVVTETIAPNALIVGTTASAGTVTTSSNIVTVALDGLDSGAVVGITNIVTAPPTSGSVLISTSASVSGAEADPNLTNNGATIITHVSTPFISITPAGATLTSESGPVNGSIDIGEKVTVTLRLLNVGNIPTTNLVATLLTNSGVSPVAPNNAQTYGQLLPSPNLSASPGSFTFVANGASGGTIAAVLKLVDAPSGFQTNVTFNFTLPSTVSFTNASYITINDTNSASPYPSTINVSGLTGVVGRVTVTLANLSHSYPHDIDALVVGPTGQDTILMSGAGAPYLTDATVTFDDAAASPVPDIEGTILSTSYRPADYLPGTNLPPNAPAGPYLAAMSVFNGVNPNGIWSLYVDDHSAGDTGSIAGGWSVAVTMISPVNRTADLAVSAASSPATVKAGGYLTNVFTITNSGPDSVGLVAFTSPLPAGVVLVTNYASQGSSILVGTNVIGSLTALGAGQSATVTVVLSPGSAAAGKLTNSAAVSATSGEADLDLANNTASAVATVVLPQADLVVSQTAAPIPVTVGSNLTFTVTVTNNGPDTALNTVLTNVLSAGSFVSATGPSYVISGGTATFSLGNLSSNAGAVLTVVTRPGATVNNLVGVGSGSIDSNPANNTNRLTVLVIGPAPQIAAAGAVLTQESGPVNGAIDPGETVTLSLALNNIGAANTANLVATLQAANGVTPVAPASANYGVLTAGGSAVSRPFTFTATNINGGVISAVLQLQDGAKNLGSVSFTFQLSDSSVLANTDGMVIPDHGVASLYPSTINVSGATGLVSSVTATLHGFTHTFPHDVSALLVSPSGTGVMLMSHTGGGHSVTNLTLTFDDHAADPLPAAALLTNGFYQPAAYGSVVLPSPAPAGPYASTLAAFNQHNPNGDWQLYVYDDTKGDSGSIAEGWSLSLTTATTVNPILPALSGMIQGGYFQLTATGQAGFNYVIQSSTNLVSWTSISTNTAAANNTVTFTDSNSPSFKYRFFRVFQTQ